MAKRSIIFLVWIAFVSGCATPEIAHYKTSTSGQSSNSKTIVLIHGMFLTPVSWSKWKSYFEQSGYKVYAPAWPLHDQDPAVMRGKNPDQSLGKLELKDVLASYRSFIKTLDEKPILIGHSMGGLIAQLLLQENLGVAAVAIDSAPPQGLISFKFSFLRSNWKVISPFQDEKEPYLPDSDAFHYAFSNCVAESEGLKIYDAFAVPESRLVGKATTTAVARIEFGKKTAPLLFVAGGEDHIVPASLNYANFERYENAPSYTEFKLFPGRCHWTVGQDGWEDVASYIKQWLGHN